MSKMIKRFPNLFALVIAALGGMLVTGGLAGAQFVSNTAFSTANKIRTGSTTLTVSSIADTELLYRTGTTIDGLAQTTFAALAGRSGGQSWTCGTGSGDDCTFTSTSHATPGNFDFVTTSAGTNDILEGLRLYRRSTGSPAAGLGYALPFYVEAAAADRVAAVLRGSLSTVTDAAEVGRFALAVMGTPAGTVPAAAAEQHVWTPSSYTLTATTTAESTATDVVTLTSQTTGLAAAGQGLCEVKKGEDDAGNTQEMGRICTVWTDVANGSEDSKIEWRLSAAGSVPAAGSGQHVFTPAGYSTTGILGVGTAVDATYIIKAAKAGGASMRLESTDSTLTSFIGMGSGDQLWGLQGTSSAAGLQFDIRNTMSIRDVATTTTFLSLDSTAAAPRVVLAAATRLTGSYATAASAQHFAAVTNTAEATGTTNIDCIVSTGWTAGAEITIIFQDILTVADMDGDCTGGTNQPINVSAALVTTAGDTLTLRYNGSTWFETGRSVN